MVASHRPSGRLRIPPSSWPRRFLDLIGRSVVITDGVLARRSAGPHAVACQLHQIRLKHRARSGSYRVRGKENRYDADLPRSSSHIRRVEAFATNPNGTLAEVKGFHSAETATRLLATNHDLWREGIEARRVLAPVPNSAETVPLPTAVADQVSAIRARRTFAEFYQAVADYQIVLAPIAALLAPQWYADMDYVDELAQRVPTLDDLSALLEYSFTEGEIAEPVVTNNQVVFSSHRRDLFCSPIPTVRKLGPGEYEIVARALSRPNYVQVARLGNRLLLTNGVHKVLAALRAGATHIPCAVREIVDLSEAGVNAQGTTLFIDATFKGPTARVSGGLP
jgi:hypothetical protein